MFLLLVGLMFAALGQGVPQGADVVLLIERGPAGGYTYTCNGKPLDPKRIATGVQAVLRGQEPWETPTFVLVEGASSFDEFFNVASLLEGHVGLRRVRYFVFSKKTRTMQEVTPKWDLWRLSFDGKLEKAR
jgi:hypothetical protein